MKGNTREHGTVTLLNVIHHNLYMLHEFVICLFVDFFGNLEGKKGQILITLIFKLGVEFHNIV